MRRRGVSVSEQDRASTAQRRLCRASEPRPKFFEPSCLTTCLDLPPNTPRSLSIRLSALCHCQTTHTARRQSKASRTVISIITHRRIALCARSDPPPAQDSPSLIRPGRRYFQHPLRVPIAPLAHSLSIFLFHLPLSTSANSWLSGSASCPVLISVPSADVSVSLTPGSRLHVPVCLL